MKLTLFRVSLPLCALVAAIGIGWPESFAGSISAFTSMIFEALDWFFMVTVGFFLGLCVYLAAGRYGKIKLGKPDEEPEFSTLSWLAMLFAAGMGVGLLFWGVAEPMMHYGSPPTGPGLTPEAARQALLITNFHWGLHAWAIYAIGALVLAYFHFRHGTPYLAGAPIRKIFRGWWVEPTAVTADLIAVISVAFGVAGSMAMGIFQLHTGLTVVAGVPAQSMTVSVILLLVLFVAYMTSAATSLDKGIKWLSNINMTLAVLLMIFVLVVGPTAFLMGTWASSVGDYVTGFVGMSLQLYPFSDADSWLQSWTLIYFIWWIAWAPFVGIFVARISRGRTIREFVIGVLLAPTTFSMLWFAIFGGMGIFEETRGQGGVARLVNEDVTRALFTLYERLPGSWLLAVVSLILVFIFLITSVDSATFVLGMLTSKGSMDPPVRRKLSWGVALAVLGGALMISNNIDVVRAAAISGAIPFAFILLLQAVALMIALRRDHPPSPPDEPTAGKEEGP